MQSTTILFASLSLCACAATHPLAAESDHARAHGPATDSFATSAQPRELPLLVPAETGITLSSSTAEELTLAGVLELFERATGQRLLITRETHQILEATHVGWASGMVLAQNEVYPFVESVLDYYGFVLVRANRDEPRLLSVYGGAGSTKRSLLGDAVHVSPDAMDECVRHPALLVHTVLDVAPLAAGDVGIALRGRIDDGRLQEIQPLGDGRHVLLTGRGRDVAQWVSILKQHTAAERTTDDHEVRGAPPSSASADAARASGVQIAQEHKTMRPGS